MSDRASFDSIALPPWWRPWQRRKNTLIFHAVRFGLALARALPFWFLTAFAAFGGMLGFVFSGRDRRRAVEQLRRAMPELKHPVRTIFRMFVHLGRIGAEFTKIDRYLTPDSPHVIFDAATVKALEDARAERKGILCITPHLGNWELYAQVAAARGYKCATVVKPTYDPRLNKLITDFRTRAGLVIYSRGDPLMLDKLQQRLRDNEYLGMLIDQDTRVAGVFVPFFGRPAFTPVIPAWLAIQAGCPVLFGYAVREGSKYRVHFERVQGTFAPPDEPEFFTGLTQAHALTAKLTALTEAAIRRYPEQWVWLHARWKRQP
jgi:KDO2-lipid IV(A) lauroyltransferase